MTTGSRRPAGSPALRVAAALLLVASVAIVAALVLGQLRPRSSVTAVVRSSPLPALPIVADTDVLGDDLLALLYLASEPDVEIRAVTVAGGAAPGCEAGVAIAEDLLAAVGLDGVPVTCGPAPAPGGLPFPAEWGAQMRSVAGSLGWGLTPAAEAPVDAVAVLRTAVEAGPVTIVSLGPPTSIARLLEDPGWPRANVRRIVQMGGAVDVAGNVDGLPAVEWNAAVDPAAMAALVASDVEVFLVSLDGTRHVPLGSREIDALTADRSTTSAALVARLLEGIRPLAAAGDYYAWDLLAAVAARQPDVTRTEAIPLRVSLAAGEAGRTVRDPAGRPVLVTVDADAAGFQRIFLDALLGRAK